MSSVVVFAKSTTRRIYEIFAIFNLIAWFAIAIHHIILAKKDNAFSKKNKILLYMSFALLFFAFWSLLGLFFVSFTPIQSDLFCIFSQQGGMHCYALFKLTLYLTLVLRLYFSFNETPVKWNKNLLISWALLLLFWTCINIISGSINMKTYVEPNQYPICTISFDMFLPALWASLDLTAAIVNSYLFISPIYALHKQMETVDETDDSALKYVAIKQGVLSLIACFTTLTTMITVALFALEPLTVGTDVNVSTMSILLMYKWNDVFVQKFCCLCSNKNEETKLHLEQVVIEKLPSKSNKTTDSKQSSEK